MVPNTFFVNYVGYNQQEAGMGGSRKHAKPSRQRRCNNNALYGVPEGNATIYALTVTCSQAPVHTFLIYTLRV